MTGSAGVDKWAGCHPLPLVCVTGTPFPTLRIELHSRDLGYVHDHLASFARTILSSSGGPQNPFRLSGYRVSPEMLFQQLTLWRSSVRKYFNSVHFVNISTLCTLHGVWKSPVPLQVSGGAILSHYAGHMLITGNSFIQNYAPSGGAVHLDHAFATIASPNNFTGNQADQGPTNIFVTGSSTNASTSLCPVGNVPGIGLGECGGLTSSECCASLSRIAEA